MDPIYVTGHRNPDTDSIVAAISYAALRNACGDREYEAACLGQVSEETRIVLDRFGFQPPTRITTCITRSGIWISTHPPFWPPVSPSAGPGRNFRTTPPSPPFP